MATRPRVSLVFAALVFCLASFELQAQNLALTVQPSAGQITFGGQVTYTIELTNASPVTYQDIFVTNQFPQAQFVSASTPLFDVPVFTVTNADNVTFIMQQFFPGAAATLSVTVQPTSAGTFTNSTLVFSDFPLTTLSTNVFTQVSAPTSDLGVSMTAPPAAVLVNDWVSYSVTAANLGSNAVSGVTVSNSLPNGVRLLSVTPTNQSYTATPGAVVLNLNTLTNGQSRTVSFLVQPTLAGTQTFSAAIRAAGSQESNPGNNITHFQLTVAPPLSTNLLATNVSAMTYNPQTGLMQQTLRLANLDTATVPSARVIVSGLTNRLYNAVGTNNGNPFVVCSAPLASGQSVDLVLEYFIPTRLPILVPNSAYQAVGVDTNSPAIPPGTPLQVTRMQALPGGNILVEFSAIPGRSYTILYSADPSFAQPLAAQPPIVAPADRVQWIDDGPPKTISAPAAGTNRFYRVLLDP